MALLWNTERIADPGLRAAVLGALAETAAPVVIRDEPATPEQVWHRWPGNELAAAAGFGDVESRHYTARRGMPKADYLGLAETRSQFRMQPAGARRELLAAPTRILDDEVPVLVSTTLLLARRVRAG